MRTALYDYCVEHDAAALLAQWHPTKNEGLTPKLVTYGSREKVWWLCERGHSWQAAVYTRTGAGSGCPYCAGKKAYPGENDIASQRPDLAAQWHPVKNGTLRPSAVTVGSQRKVWWICEKGHAWQATVKSRAGGCGCPVCTRRAIVPGDNDLAAVHPELAAQWHPTRNGALRPEHVAPGTCRKVWWRCEKGHEWQAKVSSRASGAGCPVCAGKKIVPGENDLAACFPEVAAQWHPEKNGALTADSVSLYSNRRVWWTCALGHEWQAAVASRTMRGSGCPYCTGRKVLAGFNDLATAEPKVAAQWHPELNGPLTPEMVTAGSHRKAWWQCPDGHVWKAVICTRAGPGKSGCPVCAGKVRNNRLAGHAPYLKRFSEYSECRRKG